MQAALVPQYERLRQQCGNRADRFFRDLIASVTIILLGIMAATCLVLFAYRQLVGPLHPVAQLIPPLLPGLLFICLFGLNQSRLNCHNQYLGPATAPVAFNLCWILGAYLLAGQAENAAFGLALCISLGCMAQWLLTCHSRAASEGRATPFSPDVREMGGALLTAIFGVAASQINSALDPLFAISAQAEGPAFLWYAIRIQQLPIALFGVAASSALLPPLSRAASSGDHDRFAHLLRHALLRVTVAMTACTAILWWAAGPLVDLLYRHGEFSAQDAVATVSCLRGYLLGLLPMSLVLILAPMHYSQGQHRTVTQAAVVSIALNIALNALFVWGLDWGPASIAYATSASAVVNAWLLSRR